MNLVLLGPPGAGKGTLAGLLKETLKVDHISTGDMLREEIKKDSSLGQEAKKYIESGKLVPDELVIRLIENRLSAGVGGYLLDGFPRTRKQAEDLDKILDKIHQPIEHVLNIQATLSVINHRLGGRRICRSCGAVFHIHNRPSKKNTICDKCEGQLYQRPDDNEATIKTRLEVYEKDTVPIVDYYKKQNKVRDLAGDKDSEEVYTILMKFFNEDTKIDSHKDRRRN